MKKKTKTSFQRKPNQKMKKKRRRKLKQAKNNKKLKLITKSELSGLFFKSFKNIISNCFYDPPF